MTRTDESMTDTVLRSNSEVMLLGRSSARVFQLEWREPVSMRDIFCEVSTICKKKRKSPLDCNLCLQYVSERPLKCFGKGMAHVSDSDQFIPVFSSLPYKWKVQHGFGF